MITDKSNELLVRWASYMPDDCGMEQSVIARHLAAALKVVEIADEIYEQGPGAEALHTLGDRLDDYERAVRDGLE